MSKPVVEAGPKDAFSSGDAVQREVLIPATKGQVKPVVRVGVDLQIGGPVGGIMDGIPHSGSVEFGNTPRALGVEPTGSCPAFRAVTRTVFRLPGVGLVGLVVVVVIDQAKESALQSMVPCP